MLAIWLVIVIAVVGTSLILATGVILGMNILRNQHRRLMATHDMTSNRNLFAYHRSRLSASEDNYSHLPVPTTSLRRSIGEGISATWNSLPPEERILPEDAPVSRPEDYLSQSKARRKKRLRNRLYGHSFQVPKPRRQKKIARETSFGQMGRSPLSAITEFSDSSDGPGVPLAELAAEHSPRETPEREARQQQATGGMTWPLPMAKMRRNTNDAGDCIEMQRQSSMCERPEFTRAVSMYSTASAAPDDPLPPLPVFDVYKHSRSHDPHVSTASTDTVGSSVLGTIMSSPSHVGTDLTVPKLNSEMQSFDFGFHEGKADARLGIPPSRQTMTGYVGGKSGISSIRPSVEWPNTTGKNTSMQSQSSQQESLQTINTCNWNTRFDYGHRQTPKSVRSVSRHSFQYYNTLSGRKDQYSELADQVERGSPLPRPNSVASGNPYQGDNHLKPSVASSHLSIGSSDSSKRGHRRQNCVRITNLPAVEIRNGKIDTMPELAEEAPETPTPTSTNTFDKPKIPGLDLLEAQQPVLRARTNLVDIKTSNSPSPMHNRPSLLPTGNRPKRPLYFRSSTSSSGIPRPDSDVFSTAQPSATAPGPGTYASARQLPLSPTSITSIGMNSSTPSPRDSPILPSPIKTLSQAIADHPRKSVVKGPRHFPTSANPKSPRHGSPSPTSQNHSQARKSKADLKKSVMILRSMNSEGRLLESTSTNKLYRSIDMDENAFSSNYNTSNSFSSNLALFPTVPYSNDRRPSVAFNTLHSKMGTTLSPSTMSIAAPSIWEDEPLRSDTPEPKTPTPKKREAVLAKHESTILAPTPVTPRARMQIPFPDPEGYENTFCWKAKYVSPHGKGLGIIELGGRILGTSGSLYDGDGFLKD